MVKARLKKLSVCPCGFWLLNEDIPLGTEYAAFPEMTGTVSIICGGCGRILRDLPTIEFASRSNPHAPHRPLPVEAFELEEVPNG